MSPEELGPLFVHPSQPGHLWVMVVVVAVPAIAIALLGLLRGRLRPGLGFTGLVALPAFAFLLGNLVLMERSKGTEFCGSCHATMGPVVSSMVERDDSLAGLHWQAGAVSHADGCYECHSGYGVWGGFNAKYAGVMHMVNTVTGRYELPLVHNGPFDISSCLSCHAESARFRGVEAHQDMEIQNALLAGEMSCAGMCHLPAHPADSLTGALASAKGEIP